MSGPEQLLTSWKEIAAYLKRTARTCQRLETGMGLPVHRLDGSPKAHVFAYRDEIDAWLAEKVDERKRGRRSKLVYGSSALSVVAVAVILLYVIGGRKPRSATPSAAADPPSVAILYFKNNTGNKNYDVWRTGLSDSFITKLSQSRQIRVLDSSQIFAILQRLAFLDKDNLTPVDLREIAIRGAAAYIVRGTLSKAADKFRIDLTLQNARTMQIVAPESSDGMGEESLFAMIDSLANRLEADLGLMAEQTGQETSRSLKDITTNSLEAYKYYLQGLQLSLKGSFNQAVDCLEKAVAIDARLAMAYMVLGLDYYQWGRTDYKRAMARAFELRDRVPERERFFIEAEYYQYASEHTWDKSLEAFEKLTNLYPWDLTAAEEYGFLHWRMDEWDKVIERYENLMRLKPENVGVYQTLAWSYQAKGRPDKAQRVLENYLDTIGENALIRAELGYCYLLSGNLARAKDEIDKASTQDPGLAVYDKVCCLLEQRAFASLDQILKKMESGVTGWWSTQVRGMALVWQGKLREARTSMISQIEKERELHAPLRAMSLLRFAGLLQSAGDLSSSLSVSDSALRIAREAGDGLLECSAIYRRGVVLALQSRFDEAVQAYEELCLVIGRGPGKKRIRFSEGLLGMIALQRQNYQAAREQFKRALDLMGVDGVYMDNQRLEFLFYMAKACEMSGLWQEAKKNYELVGRPSQDAYRDPIDAVLRFTSYPELGKVLEHMEDTAGAAATYRHFLGIWSDADPGLSQVEDAKKRLAKLEGR